MLADDQLALGIDPESLPVPEQNRLSCAHIKV